MAEDFPKLLTDIKLQTQAAQKKYQKATPGHVINTLHKTKDTEKILNGARGLEEPFLSRNKVKKYSQLLIRNHGRTKSRVKYLKC